MRTTLAVAFLTSLLLTAGCHERLPTAASEPHVFQLETLVSARQSGITNSRREVITDAGRWSAFLSEADLGGQSIPTVDFSKEMVIVAALGTQADSCKSVAISSATSDETRVIIHVNEQRLPASCTCPPIIVTPVHVVKTARSPGSPVFMTSRVTIGSSCS